jgi:hypothetical protein
VEDKPNFQEIPFHHEATAHEQTINLSAALYLEQQLTSKQSINQQLSTWSNSSRANNQKSATHYLEQQLTEKQSINKQLSTWSSSSRANSQSISSSLPGAAAHGQTINK